MNGMTRGARIVAGVAVTKSAKGVANDIERKKTMIDKYNEVEIEADGFITRAETLERINQSKAKPAGECMYPECEKCDKYHGHYCTVPMVVSKQIYLLTERKLQSLEARLNDLENLVTDEILRSDKGVTIPAETKLNMTWNDYLGEDQ